MNDLGKDYDINLYYQSVVSAIRQEQVEYLRKQRAEPYKQDLPEVKEMSPEKYAKLTFLQKIAYKVELQKQTKAYKKALREQKHPVDERLAKGYNAGIEVALKTLKSYHDDYCKLINKARQ